MLHGLSTALIDRCYDHSPVTEMGTDSGQGAEETCPLESAGVRMGWAW